MGVGINGRISRHLLRSLTNHSNCCDHYNFWGFIPGVFVPVDSRAVGSARTISTGSGINGQYCQSVNSTKVGKPLSISLILDKTFVRG